MNAFMKMAIAVHVRLFRATNGKIGGSMMGGKVLLLTTTGRKTGQSRTVPVMYIEDAGGHPVVSASAAGAPEDPAWFKNLVSNPEVTYEIPGKKVTAKAFVAPREQRDQLWKELTTRFPNFLSYEKKTTRVIPMVVLQ